jgi:2-keto-3-deoxy-6-phosphogluconate aldolase
VARFRRLGAVQELLLEVSALVEAGVDPVEVGTKLARATTMINELAIEFGSLVAESPPTAATGTDLRSGA